jgi:hypothetical protein
VITVKRILLALLIGVDLMAVAYWVLFRTGDRSFETPTTLQRFVGFVTVPGDVVGFFIPPTGIHSGVFDEVSFVGNSLFYSAIAYAILARWRRSG